MSYLAGTFIFSVLFTVAFLVVGLTIIRALVETGTIGGVLAAIFFTFVICPILFITGLIFFLGCTVA